MHLYIIDASSPFFLYHPKSMINWSKLPYSQIEKDGKLKKKTYKSIRRKFEKYIDEIALMGYNAISIDDVAHLTLMNFYHEKRRKKIYKYQKRFKKLFSYVKGKQLGIYLTTDIMFFNSDIEHYIQTRKINYLNLLEEILTELFQQFNEIDGVIFRIGESDGNDVDSDFKSDIVIKTAKQANQAIKTLVPVFEKNNKTLIFRTWTIGAYQVGDLNWNPVTFNRVFDKIDSKNLIISMKPGEGDFFRYLEINQQFFKNENLQKMIELQTRREYEGFGELPNFVGWEHQEIAGQLKLYANIVGIHVWCQTGGWSTFRNFSYAKNSSFFNEVNTFVTIKIFRENYSAEKALVCYCPDLPQTELLEFFRLSEEVIHELLYDPVFAKNSLYFNRSRIPPLLYVFWGFVTITNPIAALFKSYNSDPHKSIRLGEFAFHKIERMETLNQTLKIPYEQNFYKQTFDLLLTGRKFLYTNQESYWISLQKKLIEYQQKYPHGYQFHIKKLSRRQIKLFQLLFSFILRNNKNYRFIDYVLFNFLTAPVYAALIKCLPDEMPGFVNEQAMPIEKLLR